MTRIPAPGQALLVPFGGSCLLDDPPVKDSLLFRESVSVVPASRRVPCACMCSTTRWAASSFPSAAVEV